MGWRRTTRRSADRRHENTVRKTKAQVGVGTLHQLVGNIGEKNENYRDYVVSGDDLLHVVVPCRGAALGGSVCGRIGGYAVGERNLRLGEAMIANEKIRRERSESPVLTGYAFLLKRRVT